MDIFAGPCRCKEDYCHENCDPIKECVNFIARKGNVQVLKCDKHKGHTWHFNGVCMKCEANI